MYDFLNFASTTVISLLTLLLAFLVGYPQIKKTMKYKEIRKVKGGITRRGVLKGAIAVAAVSGFWGVLRYSSFFELIRRGFFSLLPRGGMLVVNSKTGVIHHKEICADHLPKSISGSTVYKLASSSRFHESKKVEILGDLTGSVSAEDAIELLLLAVYDNPTTVHLYDRLVKLLGKIKRYESIHLLLADAEARLISERHNFEVGTKRYNEYTRAVEHIVLQKQKAEERALLAALRV